MSSVPVLFERRGTAAVITLNRPEALNAINLPMLLNIRRALRQWQSDSSIAAVVLQGNGRAFCAGGDIKAVAARRGDAEFLDQVYRVEYEVNRLLHEFGRPVVALIHGATMGGGCGLSLHASHPVAAEDLVLAMPEASIGFFPDIAGGAFLSRCPGNIGLYMSLTGARIGAADARRFGLVKAIVQRKDHADLVGRIAEGAEVDSAVSELALPMPHETEPFAHSREIEEAFYGSSARAIVTRLERASSAWAHETLANLRGQCPFSLEIAARSFARAAGGVAIADVLAIDFRVAQRMTVRNDYAEGVRARLIDRDQRPVWQPALLEDVNIAEVERCFAPLATAELWRVGEFD